MRKKINAFASFSPFEIWLTLCNSIYFLKKRRGAWRREHAPCLFTKKEQKNDCFNNNYYNSCFDYPFHNYSWNDYCRKNKKMNNQLGSGRCKRAASPRIKNKMLNSVCVSYFPKNFKKSNPIPWKCTFYKKIKIFS